MKYIDKDGTIELQGEGDLVISSHRRQHAFLVDRDKHAIPVATTGFHFAKGNSPYRIVRMWQLVKLTWPYTA